MLGVEARSERNACKRRRVNFVWMPQWLCFYGCIYAFLHHIEAVWRALQVYSFFSLFAVSTDPYIMCPMDRVENLEPEKSTLVLGYKWEHPRTNIKKVEVWPSNYDENYAFPVGKHMVMWIGATASGLQKSCSLYVIVNGKSKDWRSPVVPRSNYADQLCLNCIVWQHLSSLSTVNKLDCACTPKIAEGKFAVFSTWYLPKCEARQCAQWRGFCCCLFFLPSMVCY